LTIACADKASKDSLPLALLIAYLFSCLPGLKAWPLLRIRCSLISFFPKKALFNSFFLLFPLLW
jgi:hypothetical protein